MDTPKRTLPQQQQQTGTPLASRFEDSPIFNYINSLSPIKPVKSLHIAQTFQSLSFASIPSVFTSPHANTQKDSRILIRYPLSDLSRTDLSSENGDERFLCMGVSNGPKLSNCTSGAGADGQIRCSLNKATINPPDECLAQPTGLPHSLQYDSGSPNHNTTPTYSFKNDIKLVIGSTSLIEFVHDDLEEKKTQVIPELKSQHVHHDEQPKEEVPGCDWENLIADVSEDMLIFESSNDYEAPEGQVQKFIDLDTNLTSLPPRITVDTVDNSLKPQADNSLGFYDPNGSLELPMNHSREVAETNGIDHTPHIFSSCHDKPVRGEPSEKFNDENDDSVPSGSEVESQQPRGMRRRCLVFEMAGTHRMNLCNDSNNNLSTPCHGNFSSDRQSAFLKHGIVPSTSALPSIGLHLNSLASATTDRVVQDVLVSSKPLTSMPCSISPFSYFSAVKKNPQTSLSVEKEPACGGSEDHPAVEDISQAPEVGKGEELNQNSPKKKKKKMDSGSDNESCKRCNCKKSKCLKLYCECFAAGVYCVEPCSCQGCLNKPIHEETVLATRKQIESRNPLAFAPKVIRTSELAPETGEEANKTPASARHKRGCNCKKSSCLKKYCECYQGGAGCSISCRCEGCKNTFGRKDGTMPMGVDETEHEEGETNSCGKDADKSDSQQNATVLDDKQHYPENILPITPSFQIGRPYAQLPFLSGGKPPRSSMLAVGSTPRLNPCKALRKFEVPSSQSNFAKHFQFPPEDETPEILRVNVSPKGGVKVASPNRKRVSPPHNGAGMSPSRKGCRKLILKSIPSFPSLTCKPTNEFQENFAEGPYSPSPLG